MIFRNIASTASIVVFALSAVACGLQPADCPPEATDSPDVVEPPAEEPPAEEPPAEEPPAEEPPAEEPPVEQPPVEEPPAEEPPVVQPPVANDYVNVVEQGEGTTLFLSTHYFTSKSVECVMVMGELVVDGNPGTWDQWSEELCDGDDGEVDGYVAFTMPRTVRGELRFNFVDVDSQEYSQYGTLKFRDELLENDNSSLAFCRMPGYYHETRKFGANTAATDLYAVYDGEGNVVPNGNLGNWRTDQAAVVTEFVQ